MDLVSSRDESLRGGGVVSAAVGVAPGGPFNVAGWSSGSTRRRMGQSAVWQDHEFSPC